MGGYIAKKKFLILKVIIFLVILFFVYCIFYITCSLVENPEKILSKYKIGSEMNSLPINEKEIFFQYKGDNIENINIIIRGYEYPKKYLKKNQQLIMIEKGDKILYLYFDEKKILVDKEIIGS